MRNQNLDSFVMHVLMIIGTN